MAGRIIGALITGGAGSLIAVCGWLIWKKEMISLMHDYHIDKVSEENKLAFCKRSGIGLIVIGIGLLVTAALLFMTNSASCFLCFAVCFAVGLALLISAGIKYNR